jgi:predicted acylesterase/phospholipase RssA
MSDPAAASPPGTQAGAGEREPAVRRLRSDLPFRRIALVLSGGGALGAYEVGVLRVVEAVRLVPTIVAGVSVGAINAVVWRAHGGRTAVLEEVWRRMTATDVGFRWVTLVLRALGALVATLGLVELFLTLIGSRELSGSYWLWKHGSARIDRASTVLDLWMWGLFAVAGILAIALSRPVETWLAHQRPVADLGRGSRRFGRVVLGLWMAYAAVWIFGVPWPHRFTVSALLAVALVWLANRPGRSSGWARKVTHLLTPETRGRGLWGAAGRQRLLERLVGSGDAARLVDPEVRLVISALAIDTGRIAHFVTGPPPEAAFVERLHSGLGEVVRVREPAEVLEAVLASSAIPGVFEPVRIRGRDFVDAGGFANQPLHVALAADADAALVVLMSPSGPPTPGVPPASLFALGSRLLEVANWRDMQAELRSLPAGWSREGDPARMCVVEPDTSLPGGVLGFDPKNAAALIERGEEDAWEALERAGWLAGAGGKAGAAGR